MNRKNLLLSALLGTLFVSPAMLAGPQQDQSVADAARKAQTGKKAPAKPAMVITNDNLDVIKGTISVVGEQAAPASGQAQDKSKTAAPSEAKPATQGEEYWRKAFADARKKLADDTHELDIVQREYNLKQTQYYSDPNTAMKEQFDRKDITDTKAKIDEKRAAVAQDKQAISDLEDALRQAGGDPGWASAP
jgi:hypothetical protein